MRERKMQHILGINERNHSLVYPKNKRKNYKWADDKILSKELLEKHGISCSKTMGIISKVGEIEKIWKTVKSEDKIAIKPARGSGGGGILILKKNDSGEWLESGKAIQEEDIFLHMARIIMGQYSLGSFDRVFIEECIESHEWFQKIYPSGVPDLRIILMDGNLLMAMLRLPTNRSNGKANLHQGGLGVGIEMEGGLLFAAHDGKKYTDFHPDTHEQIKGLNIPFWKEIIELSLRCSRVFPLNYLGVDIVLDQQLGPLVMEVNVRPGLGIQLANKTGLKKILKKIDEKVWGK